MANPRCKSCVFYDKQDSSPYWGRCHRFPPTQTTAGAASNTWPEVPETGWCGEHRTPEDVKLSVGLIEEAITVTLAERIRDVATATAKDKAAKK